MTVADRPPANALIRRFEEGTIDPADFDHRAHLEVAWRYLEALPPLAALDRMSSGLRRLTAALGQPGKYHETVTAFFVLLIAERRRAHPERTFDGFCRRNPDLLTNARGLLLERYSRARLDSDLARAQFLLPDLADDLADSPAEGRSGGRIRD